MATPATARQPERGVTLLESMIALTILLVGMLGMMQLQVFGLTSDSGARDHTRALQLARELAAALEKVEPDHALVDPHFISTAPPPEFGHLVQADGTLVTSGFTAWSDASPLQGVRSDALIGSDWWDGPDPVDPALPRFQRRWSIWQAETAATSGGVKLLAVSVTYRERGMPRTLREAVLLTHVSNTGLWSAFASAYR
jgi:type IV pilus assembly protein PilV